MTLHQALPKVSGKLVLPGLDASVEILRDRWGVPHIYAKSNNDLFFAQGYVHAQDRLWQMEFQRRIGHGQLSEIFGSRTLDADRFTRTLGLSRVAQKEIETLDEDTHNAIRSYACGINAWMAQRKGRLPLEFSLLRFEPRRWEEVDILIVGKILSLNLSENWLTEILRTRIIATVGEQRAAELEPDYPDGHPLTNPSRGDYHFGVSSHVSALSDIMPLLDSYDASNGSNAWVIGGSYSSTGQPLLANDPHLPIQLPSLWYENHLVGGDYQVTGASIPGAPGVIIGHTEHIAWGITNGKTDVQDLYIEKFDADDPTCYEFCGEWRQVMTVREEIIVQGQDDPFIEEVRETLHGPIVSSLISGSQQQGEKADQVLSLQWTSLEPSQICSAVLALNRAQGWESFTEAIAMWTSPVQNFIYADIDGHIGYRLGGTIPIRKLGDGRLPVPGWTGEYEWTGSIPPAELPAMLDPQGDIIVTANNRIVNEKFPQPLYAEWDPGYRAARIDEMLRQSSQHTITSFAKMHADQRSLPGLQLASIASTLPTPTDLARQARDVLSKWDGELSSKSIGGTVYAYFCDNLMDSAYREIAEPLNVVIRPGGRPGMGYLQRALPDMLTRLNTRDDAWLPAGRTWDSIILEAWNATLQELQNDYGSDIRRWHYGRKHTITFRHTLGVLPLLKSVFNRGPFATGGDVNTVCMGYVPRRFVRAPLFVGPSYRQICDPCQWDRSISIHPGGQSGQPGSRHYADLIPLWLRGEYHPMLWSRDQVNKSVKSRLTIASR
ncbi:penicillin acylase family protein [Dictyobacter arantiisoli]|nr:penicillin acylase family protein [Dictyobacter arantiisoli]